MRVGGQGEEEKGARWRGGEERGGEERGREERRGEEELSLPLIEVCFTMFVVSHVLCCSVSVER